MSRTALDSSDGMWSREGLDSEWYHGNTRWIGSSRPAIRSREVAAVDRFEVAHLAGPWFPAARQPATRFPHEKEARR
jgi:hypothetical protein